MKAFSTARHPGLWPQSLNAGRTLGQRWNWHDTCNAEFKPDPRWIGISGAGGASFRKHDAEAKV